MTDSAPNGGPIRVLHSHPVWLPKTQTWMYYLVKSLPPPIESHISCFETKHLDQFALPNVHPFRSECRFRFHWNRIANKIGLPWQFNRVQQHARTVSPHVVHSHFGDVGVADRAGVSKDLIKHVVTFYGADVSLLPRERPQLAAEYRRMFGEVDMVLCEGSFMGASLRRLGCPPEKIRVQHLGVDTSQFNFVPRTWTPGQPLRILIASSFREKKGIPFALQAIGRLAQTTEVALTIIGDAGTLARSLAEKQRILNQIAASGLENKTRLMGFQPHAEMLRQAYDHHLFVSTSVTASDGDSEGGAPVSLIEMAATGMPIVSSIHCDIPEVILDGQTGWLAEERNVDSIEARLRECLAEHQLWPEILARGRRRIECEYNLETQGQRLADLYSELCHGRNLSH